MVESTVRAELREATIRLLAAGVDSAQLDAEALLEYVLGVERVYLIAHPERRMDESEIAEYHRLVARRERREPLPHITGKREFWSLEFEVTPAVLIPRPETEILVEQAVKKLTGRRAVIADMGAGSGAIAVALAKELPDARIFATELSPEAMEVATANLVKHKMAERIVLLQGDLLEPLKGAEVEGLDAVVSNPPYIPSAEIDGLQVEVACYEPRQALDGGPDGLRFHRRILFDSRRFLKNGGYVVLEIGADQGPAVLNIARELGYSDATITKDLAGLDRVLSAVWVEEDGDT